MRSYIVATRGVRRARSDGRSDPLARDAAGRRARQAAPTREPRREPRRQTAPAARPRYTRQSHAMTSTGLQYVILTRDVSHTSHTDTQDAATHRRASATQIPLPTGRVHADTTTTKIELYNNSELDARAVLKDPP